MLFDFALILALIAANALFSATEIAVLSLRKTRLSQLLEDERRGALAVKRLRDQPERFLASVQVGITAVGAAAAAYGEESIGQRASAWLGTFPWLEGWARPLGFIATISVVTFLSVVLGELVPKSLALRSPEPVALALSRPLILVARATRPAVWLLTACSNAILRLFGDKTSFTEARLSPDELHELVEEAARTGELDGGTADLASRALDLRELNADDVMQPRTQMTALPVSASVEQLRTLIEREMPDRITLYEGTIDTVVGYLAVKDVARTLLAGRPVELTRLMRSVLFVPPGLRAVRLLSRMQSEGVPLAVVLDEGGGTKGIVALEDLLEELVGEVHDDSLPPRAGITTEDDGSLVVPGDTPLRDLKRTYGLELEESEHASTIAGLCLELAGRIPTRGTMLSCEDGTVLEVIDADPKSVRLVRVRTSPETAPSMTDAPP